MQDGDFLRFFSNYHRRQFPLAKSLEKRGKKILDKSIVRYSTSLLSENFEILLLGLLGNQLLLF
jgi:hypothetical protein